jgi:hypothetical protein
MSWVLDLFNKAGVRIGSSQNGWISVKCPFCDDHSKHLGIHQNTGVCNCWRCGTHGLTRTLSELAGIPEGKASVMVRELRPTNAGIWGKRKIEDWKPLALPPLHSLGPKQRGYLEGRGYDSDALASQWGLQAFGPIGRHCFGIYIPVTRLGKVVAFQSRLPMDGYERRYISSSPKKEGGMDIKECIYGLDLIPDGVAIICEGPADVWRLGPGAICTLGTAVSPKQRELLSRLERRHIMFDNEEQAQIKARKLAEDLESFPGMTAIIPPEQFGVKDAGSMTDKQAREFMYELGFRR